MRIMYICTVEDILNGNGIVPWGGDKGNWLKHKFINLAFLGGKTCKT